MKNIREQLITLLKLSSDDQSAAIKLQLLSNITRSAEYSALSKSNVFKQLFEDLFERSKLKELGNSELRKRLSLLKKLSDFSNKLVQSIRCGNATELSVNDTPDFTSSSSITAVLRKIRISPDITNYTNLTEDNALEIFSDKTIKSAQECFDMLPVAITKSAEIDEETIKLYMGETLFCINIEEFNACHEGFLALAETSEAVIEKERFRKRKRRLLKIAIVMLCFGAIYTCCQFSMLLSAITPMLLLGMIIIAIPFLIWG